MSEHTWRYQRELTRSHELPDRIRFEVYNESGVFRHVATCEHEDDAQLIAAAPDLLTALEQVLDMGLNGHDDMLLAAKRGFELTTGDIRGSEAAVIAARAAIKKARGG